MQGRGLWQVVLRCKQSRLVIHKFQNDKLLKMLGAIDNQSKLAAQADDGATKKKASDGANSAGADDSKSKKDDAEQGEGAGQAATAGVAHVPLGIDIEALSPETCDVG